MKPRLSFFFVSAAIVLALAGSLIFLKSYKNSTPVQKGIAAVAVPSMEAPAVPAPTAPVSSEKPVLDGKFELSDLQGNKVTEASWPGKTKLVFFGFTRCPDICPTTLQKLSAVMESADPKGEKLVPLFVSLDHEYDTAAVMKEYLSHYSSHIVGLTGTPEQLKAAEDSYKVFVSQTEKDQINHSGYIYVVSPKGEVTDVLGSEEPMVAIIGRIGLHSQ